MMPGWAGLLRRLQLGVELRDEAFRGFLGIWNPRIKVRCWMRGEYFILRLALCDQLRHPVANRQNHIPVRHYFGSPNHRAMSRHDLCIWACESDQEAKAVDHAVETAA